VVSVTDVVQAMQGYYARRAAEYERVYQKPERQAELRAIEAWIGPRFAGRDVLEIASGTGWWLPHASASARAWLATDLNEETLAVARAKALPGCVRFATLDAYDLNGLPPGRRFDAAFAGFWWSHVPLARLAGWLAQLHERLLPGARVVFLDNSHVPGSSLPITRRDADGNTYQRRTLDDGSEHEVLKNFPTREQALALPGPRARHARFNEIGHPLVHYWVLEYELD
jgi:demethylmenaquinone methyltransferase/2-methoxy-6-polyprenyl-1,4-benzoquinol methylase